MDYTQFIIPAAIIVYAVFEYQRRETGTPRENGTSKTRYRTTATNATTESNYDCNNGNCYSSSTCN